MTKFAIIMEAIASVALSHDDWCSCPVCRAARGDQAALDAILVRVYRKLDEEETAARDGQ